MRPKTVIKLLGLVCLVATKVVALQKRKEMLQKKVENARIMRGKSQGLSRDSSAMSLDLDTMCNDPPPLPPPPPPPLSPPPLSSTGRPKRTRRLPKRYIDTPPEGPAPIAPVEAVEPLPPPTMIQNVVECIEQTLRTGANRFNLWREYSYRPSYDPDSSIPLEDLLDCPTSSSSTNQSSHMEDIHEDTHCDPSESPPPWPFANMSIYRLMEWATTGSNRKSEIEVNRLVNTVIGAPDFRPARTVYSTPVTGAPDFRPADLTGFSARRERKRFDSSDDSKGDDPFSGDGWKTSPVDISIPTGNKDPTGKGQNFTVSSLHYRSLLPVMKAALKDATARYFHFTPFKRFWKPPSGSTVRCFDEVYTSDAFLDANKELQEQPNETGCKLEKVVLGLMFWSDSTHLASFGTAKAWPLYLYFANLSKYFRGKPNFGASHHVAYIPSLPDSINDVISSFSQKDVLLTHCRRELMHKVWNILLDSDFLAAYEHGFILTCLDGIARRFYPRIFTYSADYPEKVLIAAIRDKGLCPCPRCLIPKTKIDKIGYIQDARNRIKYARSYGRDLIARARDFIYRLGYGVTSAAVERLLKPASLVPTLNMFGEKLSPFGFNPYVMLVVDLLHEFELGIWKAIFTHLLRLLNAAAPAGRLVAELDRRFRQVPTFGLSTIRRFGTNASEMKKLAARDFEDLLQCAIPVFEGLLPEPHNQIVLTLLYRLAEWHALAKLRIHTDSTLTIFESVTTSLCRELRKFRDFTCEAFETVELQKEANARARRRSKAKTKSGPSAPSAAGPEPLISVTSTSQPGPLVPPTKPPGERCKKKVLNISTYKFHALPDYVGTIRQFGTTDSYSTQTGELEHRRIKRLYGKTNKREAIQQMTRHERRETRLLRAQRSGQALKEKASHPHLVPFSENDPMPCNYVEMHHHISDSRKHYQDAFWFTKQSPNDPATANFVSKLKDHLLGRLLNIEYDGDEHNFSDTDRNTIHIVNNRIYSAKVLRVNFTTYDVRRDRDSMNPRTHCDVMVQSQEDSRDAHPFWYARVLGVFHAQIFHTGPLAKNRSLQHMEFLWVRWFGIVAGHQYGANIARLPKIGFLEETDPSAFGFLDPSLIIRGCHLIPAFTDGRTEALLSAQFSLGRPIGETDDWVAFYVMIFADRDMYMRFLGGGVGHVAGSSPETRSNDDADMDWRDESEGDDGNSGVIQSDDEAMAEKEDSDSEPGSDDSQIGGDDEEEEDDLGPDDGEGDESDDDDFATF